MGNNLFQNSGNWEAIKPEIESILSKNKAGQYYFVVKQGEESKTIWVVRQEWNYKVFPNLTFKMMKKIFIFTLFLSAKLTVYAQSTKDSTEIMNDMIAQSFYLEGMDDAKLFYKPILVKRRVYLTYFLAKPISFIYTIVESVTKPQIDKVTLPDPTLFDNGMYKKGYIKQARKMKKIAVWKAFGISVATDVAINEANKMAKRKIKRKES